MAKKILIILLIVIVIIIGILIGVGNYFFNSFFKKEKTVTKELIETQEESVTYRNVEYLKAEKWWGAVEKEELNINSTDGLKLVGYFLPAKQTSDKLVILAHGDEGASNTMALFAYYYYNEGFNVFVPDNRAFGKSAGEYYTMGWLDREDYEIWIDKLVEKLGQETKVVLHGVSYGATTALLLSNSEKLNIKCIIEDSGYSNLEELLSYKVKRQNNIEQFPAVHMASLVCKIRQGYLFSDVDVLKSVCESKYPILFIHSRDDDIVPEYMAYVLYEHANCEKELWMVDGNKHGILFFTDNEEYKNKIKEFYSKYI